MKVTKVNIEKQRCQEDAEINRIVKKIHTISKYDLLVSTRPELVLACRAFIKSFYG